MNDNPILWQPTEERQQRTAMYRFMRQQNCDSYAQLYQWSIDELAAFWPAFAEFCQVRFSKPADTVLQQPGDMTSARWFVGSELSFAEHMLRHCGELAAIIFYGEDGSRREISFDNLCAEVAAVAAEDRAAGTPGSPGRGYPCRIASLRLITTL